MKKKIKKYGNTAVIVLTKEDLETEGWNIGDFLDLSDVVKIKKRVEKKQNGKNI